MVPIRKSASKLSQARRWLAGQTEDGALIREDSDDELGYDDYPWEWIYEQEKEMEIEQDTFMEPSNSTPRKNSRKRKHSEIDDTEKEIIGAKMGKFICKVGDTVMVKAADNETWVALVCDFRENDQDEKEASFMWFSSPAEIRNKGKKRNDFVSNEFYITPSWDWNPLTSINGKGYILSKQKFDLKYPKGTIPRNNPGYGKTIICRRGCNLRTATYTEEFIWEDIYKDINDLGNLVGLIQSQTKSSRRVQTNKLRFKEKDHGDDYEGHDIVKDRGDDGEFGRNLKNPKTPRKKQKFNINDVNDENDDGNEDFDDISNTRKTPKTPKTPKSSHKSYKYLTPRKFVTPSHKRIITKKPLEITPLGTRILPAEILSSPYAAARANLHVSSVPVALPCREEEFSEVYMHLERAITAGTGSCIYIAGVPGTGKTATVREVVTQLQASVASEELDDFVFVEINGMKVTDPHQSYSILWESIKGDRVSNSHALELLSKEFSTPSPRRVPIVVLMDELDQLVTTNQSVMYNFFNWPSLPHSRLIVLAVANTMDLPERTLSNKISSRLGLHRITFPGYSHSQLIKIIESRLSKVPGTIIHSDAIQFASRKVAAVSGDARRCLDICRRAVEIAEKTITRNLCSGRLGNDDDDDNSNNNNRDTYLPVTPSKTGRGSKKGLEENKTKNISTVTIATIKQAIFETTSSPLQKYLRGLPLASKVFLAALLSRVRRTGVMDSRVGDILDEARRLTHMTSGGMIRKVLLLEKGDDKDMNTSMNMNIKGIGLASRIVGMENAILCLSEAGIIGAESKGGERGRRVRLIIGDEEIRLAYREDQEVIGLGFN